MNLTDYSKIVIRNHVLGVEAMPFVTTPYVALLASAGEPIDDGYARQAATFQMAGTDANNTTVVSHIATGDWGILQYIAIADTLTEGEVIFSGDLLDENGLKRQITIDSEEHRFEVGDIEISLSGNGSDWLNIQILQHLLGISEFVMPTEHWLAIFGDDANLQTGTGSFSEPTTGGYARQQCQFNEDGALEDLVNFAIATAPYDKKAKYIGVMTAETDGNVMFYKPLEAVRVIKTGGWLEFPANTGLGLEVN